MAKSQVDPEDFQAWMDNPVTKWVRQRFREKAALMAQTQAELLLNSSVAQTPAEWAVLQLRSAHLLGQCEASMVLADLTYADVREETDEEIAEMEKLKE
jgi:hypothetical protein